jgi:ankyrin repeat protein
LFVAASGGQVEAFKLLLSAGGKCDVQDKSGRSVFDVVREKGHASLASLIKPLEVASMKISQSKVFRREYGQITEDVKKKKTKETDGLTLRLGKGNKSIELLEEAVSLADKGKFSENTTLQVNF